MADLKSLIDSCIADPRYADGRRRVREESWAYAGEGTVRAAEYLIHKHEELTHAEEEL